MTDKQIIQIALKHLLPYDESGELQWWGKEEQLLKFAIAIHENGYSKGYCEGYKSGSTGVFGEPLG